MSNECSDCSDPVEIKPGMYAANRCEPCRVDAYTLDGTERAHNSPQGPFWPFLLLYLSVIAFSTVLYALTAI